MPNQSTAPETHGDLWQSTWNAEQVFDLMEQLGYPGGEVDGWMLRVETEQGLMKLSWHRRDTFERLGRLPPLVRIQR